MIDGIPPAAVGSSARQSLGQLDSDAFLQLLVAQMRFQNPLSPMDPSQMMAQTAQFTQVETLQQMAEVQRHLLGLEWASVGTALLGKQVSAAGPDGETITGVAQALRTTDQGPVLLVDGTEVPVGSVFEVLPPPPHDQPVQDSPTE